MGKKKNFETAIKRLEEIVKELESGEVELDKSIAFFTEGMEMVKTCKEELQKAEEQVKILLNGQEENFTQMREEQE